MGEALEIEPAAPLYRENDHTNSFRIASMPRWCPNLLFRAALPCVAWRACAQCVVRRSARRERSLGLVPLRAASASCFIAVTMIPTVAAIGGDGNGSAASHRTVFLAIACRVLILLNDRGERNLKRVEGAPSSASVRSASICVIVLPSTSVGTGGKSGMIRIRLFARPVPQRRVALVWRKSFPRPQAIEASRQAVLAYDLPQVTKPPNTSTST